MYPPDRLDGLEAVLNNEQAKEGLMSRGWKIALLVDVLIGVAAAVWLQTATAFVVFGGFSAMITILLWAIGNLGRERPELVVTHELKQNDPEFANIAERYHEPGANVRRS